MTIQYIIITIILGVCLCYAGYRVYITLTDSNSACKDCQLKDACTRHARQHKQYPDGCERES